MNMKPARFLPFLALIVLLTLACGVQAGDMNTVVGSGILNHEERVVQEFTVIEVVGSADVSITIGKQQSLIVEADENILPVIETNVSNKKLIIGAKPLTSISISHPIRVTVVVKSLDVVRVSGSGNITIHNLAGKTVKFDLPGSGNLTAAGTADQVIASIGGSGNILCGGLEARSATVKLSGSGNVKVFASDSLDASIGGSGTIQYRGNPAAVNQSVTGSGNIISIP
jgi:hypothetical protein